MTVESASYISQLNATYPTGADAKSEGDDHVRLLKNVLKTQFPNFGAAALAASNTQLDKLVTTFTVTNALNGAVTVTSGGDVGVGTSSPAGRLELYNTSAACQLYIRAANTSFSEIYFSDTDSNTPGAITYSHTDNFLGFYVNSTERIRVDQSGNVVKTVTASAPTLLSNNKMVFSLPSDTQLQISVRGSDGVTRTANIALS